MTLHHDRYGARKLLIAGIVVGSCVGCDQATKVIAQRFWLQGQACVRLPDHPIGDGRSLTVVSVQPTTRVNGGSVVVYDRE